MIKVTIKGAILLKSMVLKCTKLNEHDVVTVLQYQTGLRGHEVNPTQWKESKKGISNLTGMPAVLRNGPCKTNRKVSAITSPQLPSC